MMPMGLMISYQLPIDNDRISKASLDMLYTASSRGIVSGSLPNDIIT